MSDLDLYKRAIEKWGEDSQILKTLEELGELVKALSNYLAIKTTQNAEKVIEEMADVSIMLEQLRYFTFDEFEFQKYREFKLERLENLLDEI